MSTAKEDGIFNEETGRNFLEKFWGRAEYRMFCNYSLIFGDREPVIDALSRHPGLMTYME